MRTQSELIAEVERRLDAAVMTLSRLNALDRKQAERIGTRIDRVTSQLNDLTPPPGHAA